MLEFAKLVHEAIGIANPKTFIAVFALCGMLLFGGLGYLIDRGYRIKLKETTPTTNTADNGSLRLAVPRFQEGVDEVQIQVGTNIFGVPMAQLAQPMNPFEQAGVRTPFVRIYVKDRVLCVDTEITTRSRPGKFKLKCNRADLEIPGWDLNSSDRALELVDDSGTPVFQLIFLSPGRISIRGTFTDGNRFMALTDSFFLTGPGTEPPQPVPPLKPIFKHPSWKFPGVYAE